MTTGSPDSQAIPGRPVPRRNVVRLDMNSKVSAVVP